MAIKSISFGRTELSGKDAERFIRHMQDDAPSPRIAAALVEGRVILQKMRNKQK